MPLKIAACVILYNPENSVEQNISSYINYVEKIYVIDNTEATDYNYKFLSSHQSKIIFIHDGLNEGIARRLNQACTSAIKDGLEYILTMDQDSYFTESPIAEYLRCIENFAEKKEVAMFGVNYQSQEKKQGCNFNKTKFLITSGSIINLNAYKLIGGFDENLFIDFVDTEYCFRSVQRGYEIIKFSNVFMHHSLGELSEQLSFKNLKKSKRSIHSSQRLYYMMRNFLYLNSKYKKQFKVELIIHRKDLLNRIKNNLLYKSGRIRTISLLMKACNDFKNNRMGKMPG